jgi:hypothetical protein
MMELAVGHRVAAAEEPSMTHRETNYRPDADPDHPIIVAPKQARAGRPGVPVLYVLLWSTALAVAILLAIWIGFHLAVR